MNRVARWLMVGLIPLQAAAGSGDLMPRPGGDGLVSASDLVAARRLLDGLDEASTGDRRAVDVSKGQVEDAFITPPTRLPVPSGSIDEDDVDLLADLLLARVRLPDTPGLVLEEGRTVALAGVAWRNRAVLVSRSLRRASFVAQGAPDGLVLDATTGEILWTPAPEQAGMVSFDVIAIAPPEVARCRVDVRVILPRLEAAGEAGPGGLSLSVEDPTSPVNGLSLAIPAGVLPEPVAVTVLTAPEAAGPARDDGMALGPPVVVVAATTTSAEISLPVSDALVAAAGGAERLAWEVLTIPFADCENLVAAEGRSTWWPAWSRLPSALVEGRVVATVPLFCTGPAMARLVGTELPPLACPADNDGQDIVLDVRRCPAGDAWLVADARAAVQRARDRFAELGHDVPGSLRVVIDDLGPGHSAYADAVAPATIRLDAGLSRDRMLVAAAHETFHSCQQRALQSDCGTSPAARGSHALLIEGMATWMEQQVFDDPADPVPSDTFSGRVLASPARRPLDALGPEGWPFFDWLDTSIGVTALDILDLGPAVLASPPLETLDALVGAAGRGPWPEALTRFAHDLNVERDPAFIRELDELALPSVTYDVLDTSAADAPPLTRCGIVLPHGTAFTWPLRIMTSEGDDGLASFLGVEASGDVQVTLYAVDSPERLRTIEPGETAAIGLRLGPAALHVVNPRLADGDDDPIVVDLSAWVAAPSPYETDTDGDGWPDRAEEEAGTDPRRASSYPLDVLAAAPPIQLALTRRDPAVAAPRAQVALTAREAVVAVPPVQLALTTRDPTIASPPLQVGLTTRDVVVAAPPLTVVPEGP